MSVRRTGCYSLQSFLPARLVQTVTCCPPTLVDAYTCCRAQHNRASRQTGLILCKAENLTGGTPTKHVQVLLPDGQRQQWRLTSPKDLDRILNANKLGGSALVNKSIEPPLVITAAQEVDENEVYHVLPPWHSSRFRSNVTIWLPSEDDEGPVKCIFPTITQPILTSLLATMGVAGVRSADQPDGVTLADISLLEDGAEYFGIAMKASTLRSAVRHLKRVDNKLEEANEDALRERLHLIAAQENPSGTVESICRKTYSQDGEQVLEIDAAVTVSFPNGQAPLAYVAERKRTLTLATFQEVVVKWALIRGFRDSIPEVEEDYGGVENAKLFVAGDVLATKLTLDEIVKESRRRNIRVFSRNGQEYDLENSCWPKP